ncbi:MAG: hypothetical protein FJ121_10775 [Deltaproteobacteria bacterium]|nr:hypothetical protein [Deltaproteobacteria bacterium]
MLTLIPRHHFGKLETEHGTGRKARSFTRLLPFGVSWCTYFPCNLPIYLSLESCYIYNIFCSAKLKYPWRPMIRWSWTVRLRLWPAFTRARVSSRSAADGVR